jgi:hypothetical protein
MKKSLGNFLLATGAVVYCGKKKNIFERIILKLKIKH